MPLDVIGAGFGRTGTMSLKLALEQLGFGPCYHMVSVLSTPGAADHWAAAASGGAVDWETVFDGYRATTDWPACDYWRELTALWPAAKVILTVRETERWFRSTQETIFGPTNTMMADDPSPVGITMRAIAVRHFGGNARDRDACLAAYARHNETVRREVPADRLLVFDIAEGWAPLCAFLGVDVPDAPFPHANTTDEFHAHAAEMMARAKAGGGA